ncbi:MAG: hypothetical protein JXR12_06155 [Neptunomonas phycophila]|uniref:hypothetical protein n=1 Tax=Neptunomonas phycophila TaxID=1572645 RepID=UPI003B8E8D7D
MCTPNFQTDNIDYRKQVNETYNHGTITFTGVATGDPAYNVYGMLLSDDNVKYSYYATVTCNEDVTVVTGRAQHRSPDIISGSYFCPKGTELDLGRIYGWVTLTANGTADKFSTSRYRPSQRDLGL